MAAEAKEVDMKKMELMKEVRAHQVAIGELNNLPPSRAAYQKTCNIFFRKDIKSAVASKQKKEDDPRPLHLTMHAATLLIILEDLTKWSVSWASYQKTCNIFFRKDIKSALASQQKQLDTTKAKLQKLDQA